MPSPDLNGTSSRTPLSDYIRMYQTRTGLSHNQMAKQGRDPDTGNQILVQWLLEMIAGHVARAPELWRLRALAAAMASGDDPGRDVEQYRQRLDLIRRLAAVQWFEMSELLFESSHASVLAVRVPPSLSEHKRRMVVRWAETTARDLAEM
ncbi:MAG: hypothetical protein JWQ95_849 [Sphaerisporangium sp.]|jgi:hypothetical protein|nr:hypothetical protein [Sphaerisporangium sp.]